MKLRRILTDIIWLLIAAIIITLMVTHKKEINTYVSTRVTNVLHEKVVVPTETYNARSYSFETVRQTNNFEPNNMQDLKDIYYTVLNNGWESFTFYCPVDYNNCLDDVLSIAKDNIMYLEINNY